MTRPHQHRASLRPPRIVTGILAAFALLHMSSASASPTGSELVGEVLTQPDASPQLVDSLSDVEGTEAELMGQMLGEGMASYYGAELAGRRTASGERFDPRDLTAAHRTLPFGSKVRVTNAANGRSVVVRINDRGPFSHGRLIDLSRSAAEQIGLVARGHGEVQIALLGG